MDWSLFADDTAAAPAAAGASAHPLFDDLRTRWTGWLQQPGNRQALLQAGLAMSQPRPVGQSFAGHAAAAIGAGVEAKDRNLAIRQSAQDATAASSRQDRALELDAFNAETGRMNADTQSRYAMANAGPGDPRTEFVLGTLTTILANYDPILASDGATLNEFAKRLAGDQELTTALIELYNNVGPAAATQQLTNAIGPPSGGGPETPAIGDQSQTNGTGTAALGAHLQELSSLGTVGNNQTATTSDGTRYIYTTGGGRTPGWYRY